MAGSTSIREQRPTLNVLKPAAGAGGPLGPPRPAGLTLTLQQLLVASAAASLTELGPNLHEVVDSTI